MLAARAVSRCASAVTPAVRRMGTTASFSYDEPDPDYIVFPRESPGLSYDLNWSLADDNVTPHGAAFRNASVKELLMHCTGKLSASKAITCGGSAEAAAGPFATVATPQHSLLSLDDFDAAAEDVCTALSHAGNLFVEDASVGSTRESQVRLRVISDSAEYALVLRNLLVRTPLYHPEAFPRPIVVYVASGADHVFAASDVDTANGKASVLVSGAVDIGVVRDQIAHVAAELLDAGGYRHVRGGGPRLQAAREEGNVEWYVDDRYIVADAGEPHPDLLRLRASAVVSDGRTKLVVGDAAPGPDAFAAHDVVWTASGIDRMWDGVTTGARHSDDLPRGAITFQGATTAPLNPVAAATAPHPTEIVAPSDFPASLGLSDSQAGKLEARLKAHNVRVVSA